MTSLSSGCRRTIQGRGGRIGVLDFFDQSGFGERRQRGDRRGVLKKVAGYSSTSQALRPSATSPFKEPFQEPLQLGSKLAGLDVQRSHTTRREHLGVLKNQAERQCLGLEHHARMHDVDLR
ncbi:hypothetical protein [Azotobacter armeniacus]